MSNGTATMRSPTELAQQAASVAVRSLWSQWAIINPSVAFKAPDNSNRVIDLEALVLASAALSADERRFDDLVGWLAGHASAFLSVQRMRTLMNAQPRAEWSASDFARWALEWGSDRRWKTFVRSSTSAVARRGKGPDEPRADAPATLMLRCRAAFGVGVKADLMTYMLCLDGEARNAPEIARDIGYTDKTVRLGVRDLRLAGLVEKFGDYPVTYATRPGFAAAFLNLWYARPVHVPTWCPWQEIYSFLVELAGWRLDPSVINSPYKFSSKARDLFEKYEAPFRFCQLRMPRPEAYTGEEYLAAVADFLTSLELWIERERHV